MAAAYRDCLRTVEELAQKQRVQSLAGEDVDVFGDFADGGNLAVSVLHVRGGTVLDTREFFWEGIGDVDPEEFWVALLSQYYDATTFLPREVHLPDEVAGGGARPRRDVALGAARLAGGRCGRRRGGPRSTGCGSRATTPGRATCGASGRSREAGEKATLALAKALDLDQPARPDRVLRHLPPPGERDVRLVRRLRRRQAGEGGVPGVPDRPSRAGRLRVDRRGRHPALREAPGRGRAPFPDLLVIDGGKGQLSAALAALDRIGVEIPAVGLAKREEEVFVPGRSLPVVLPRRHAGPEAPSARPRRGSPVRPEAPPEGADAPDADEPAPRDPGPRPVHRPAAPGRLRERRGGPRGDAGGARRGRREGGGLANRQVEGFPGRHGPVESAEHGHIEGRRRLAVGGHAREDGARRRPAGRRTPRRQNAQVLVSSAGRGTELLVPAGPARLGLVEPGGPARRGAPPDVRARRRVGPLRRVREGPRGPGPRSGPRPARTRARSPRTSPTPASAPSRRRSSTRRSSGARGPSPSSRSTVLPDVPAAFDQTTADAPPRRRFAASRRSSGPAPRIDPKARPVLSPDLLLRYQCAVVTPEEAEALDGDRRGEDRGGRLPRPPRPREAPRRRPRLRGRRPADARVLRPTPAGVASLNVEVAGAPPGPRLSEVPGAARPARLEHLPAARLDRRLRACSASPTTPRTRTFAGRSTRGRGSSTRTTSSGRPSATPREALEALFAKVREAEQGLRRTRRRGRSTTAR